MATKNEDTKTRSESEALDESQVIENANIPADFPGSINEPPGSAVKPPESNVSGSFAQTVGIDGL